MKERLTVGPWQQSSGGEVLAIALLVGCDVNHSEEAGLAEEPLFPPFHGMNKYLLSTYYFSK